MSSASPNPRELCKRGSTGITASSTATPQNTAAPRQGTAMLHTCLKQAAKDPGNVWEGMDVPKRSPTHPMLHKHLGKVQGRPINTQKGHAAQILLLEPFDHSGFQIFAINLLAAAQLLGVLFAGWERSARTLPIRESSTCAGQERTCLQRAPLTQCSPSQPAA